MRITLRLVLAIVTVVSVIVLAFTLLQVRQERQRQMGDLKRRTSLLAESLGESVEPLIGQGQSRLQRIVEKFGNRERLAGVAVYDTKGLPLAVTRTLARHVATAPKRVIEAITADREMGDLITIGDKLMYVFVLPLHPEAQVAGALTLFHDASYIQYHLRQIWQHNFLRLLVQALLISLTALFVIRWTLIGSIARMAERIKRLRKGEIIDVSSLSSKDLLNPLATEVTHLARSLSAAKAAAEDAKFGQVAETPWTPRSLKEHLRVKLQGRPIFVISNREPYIHVKRGDRVECVVPASGLVTALEPVLAACEGTWIAHGSGDADSVVVDDADRLRVPPGEPSYTLRRVWLTKAEEQGYYYGFANEGLWPLCHIAHTRPVFRADDWQYYRDVNNKFAQVTLAELEGVEEPCVLIQDYHFALLPRLIKARRPDARVGIFWHIPWPNPESFGICPWQRELLHGMLGADLIGFHIQFHCNNFLETVDRVLESRIEWEHFAVRRGNSTTYVKPFPISIAFLDDDAAPGEGTVEPRSTEALLMDFGIRARYLAIGVDRLDYTKGLLERLRGIERFLEKYPTFQGEFTFVELGAPSRTHIKQYQDLIAAIEAESDRINRRFQNGYWKPILLLKQHHTGKAIQRFYQAADACLVTSLHDGMNLVAKEFVAARKDEQGVLILSRFTGASRELHDAIIVNPYDVEEIADAIYAALNMAKGEQALRMRRMREVVRERNVYRWAADLITDLVEVRVEESRASIA